MPEKMTADRAIVNPQRGKNSPRLGEFGVMVGSSSDLDLFRKMPELDTAESTRLFMGRLYQDTGQGKRYSVTGPMIGAPYAAMILETIIAWGVRKVVFLGWCGAISPEVKIGDILVPHAAFIDEGTSGHYQADDPARIRSSSDLLKAVKAVLKRRDLPFREGAVWSTDAIYRETGERVAFYQAKGALAVEMEMSALLSVGRFRNVEVVGILVVSDELSTFQWRPGFRERPFRERCRAAVEAVMDVCRGV